MSVRRDQRGFSLIELAIVLVIIGLLVGGGIAALNAVAQQTRRTEAERQLEHVREALYGFAMSEGRLPCPDTNDPPDGSEDLSGNDCDDNWGALPWSELQLGRRDPWGSLLLYRVDPDFADTNTSPAFALSDSGNLTVEDGEGNNIVTTSPAVIVAFGPQGAQIWTDSGFTCPSAGTNDFSADESENCDDDNTFVAAEFRPPDAGTDPTNPGEGRFDDVLIWVPLPVLKARMVDAGLLP
ncbi:MAG: type II secretion system protein [Halofilum sp. (in: g-proteobacteria)]|nr:type II secretion system protein [Halofilum sp. (in: g-proteobacteria)]